jgi:eukaryotic-like serine/threonine-protein kinase
VREPAVPPSHHDADLTPDIDKIVMKALAKRVEDRYQSAGQMRADIERYLAGRPVSAVLPPPPEEPPATATAVVPAADPSSDTMERQRPVPPADDRDDGGRKLWLWLVLGLLVLALLAAAFFAWPKLFPDEPTDVQVPSVIGFERDRARELLSDEGLTIDDKQRQCDDQYNAGQVVDQEPAAEEYVAPGSEVTLVLSSGPCDFAMPDVTGDLQRIAIATLVDAGIKRGNISTSPEKCDTDEPAGTVVEQTPEPQASVGRDDSVMLCVSDGPEKVPEVIGLRQGQAERLILEAGFEVDIRDDNESEEPKGEVTDVIPGEGEELDQGETVTIFVSTFEEPTTSAPPPDDTDTDEDGLSDADEAQLGTDPNNPDSDGDTFTDGDEVEAGSDPLDPLSFPPPDDDNGNGNGGGPGEG